MTAQDAKKLVRDVPDFPKKGIIFKDITPVLADPKAFALICDELSSPFLKSKITKVLAVESRGFIFGAAVAERLNVGFVPVRKAGKLPWKTVKQSYTLEYGEAALEMHSDALNNSDRVLLVDDVLATGGTLRATQFLAQELGAEVVGASCLIELEFLKGRELLVSRGISQVHAVWKY